MLFLGCGQFTIRGPIVFCIVEFVSVATCHAGAPVLVHADVGDYMWEMVELGEGQSLVCGEIKAITRNPDLTRRCAICTVDLLFVGGKRSGLPSLAPVVRVPIGIMDMFAFEGIVYFTEYQHRIAVRTNHVFVFPAAIVMAAAGMALADGVHLVPWRVGVFRMIKNPF